MSRYLDDFRIGDSFETPGVTLTEGMILDFALTYDPQPFHIDIEAARDSQFGGLIASGFQTVALVFRLFMQTGVTAASDIGGSGMDQVRWLLPVRPGDTLRATVEVAEVRPHPKRNDRGAVRFRYTARNQRGETVLTMICEHLIARRPEAALR